MFSARSLFFWLAALSVLMVSIDGTVVAVAIPTLTASLDTSLNWVGWTLTSYQLVQLMVMPLAGKLSDALGRKRVFIASIVLFTAGSLLCGLAPNIGFLIFFRAVQAIGGGGVMPSAAGIVSDQFKEHRNKAIGLISSIFSIGGVLGPNIGGWILQTWTWREIFFVNLPIGILVLVGTQLILRERVKQIKLPRIDFPGLGFFVGGIVAIMYAMTWIGSNSGTWRTPEFWVLIATGIALLLLFVRQERRVEDPLLDVQLVARQPFLPTNIFNFFFGGCAIGFASFIPYYAVVRYGMSPSLSGAVTTSRSVGAIIMSVAFSLLFIKLGYRIPIIAGMLVMSAGMAVLSFGPAQVLIGPFPLEGFWLLSSLVALVGLGTGMAAPASNNACLDLAPEKAAAMTGLRGMFRHIGSIMGISTTVLVLSFFEDQAAGMQVMYAVYSVVLIAIIPLVLMIPDTARQRYRKARHAPGAGLAQGSGPGSIQPQLADGDETGARDRGGGSLGPGGGT